jgi:hypothetical protein
VFWGGEVEENCIIRNVTVCTVYCRLDQMTEGAFVRKTRDFVVCCT